MPNKRFTRDVYNPHNNTLKFATMTAKRYSAPGLWVLLGAIVYDTLLLVPVLMIASIPVAVLVPETLRFQQPGLFINQLYLLIIGFLYFGWFWTRSGQTLGMVAWRLRLVTDERTPIGWQHALFRAITALFSWSCLGAGFIWVLFSKERRSWHDTLSRTHLERDPKKVKVKKANKG